MRFVITGGAGFIGSHVSERLIAGGHDVRVIDNLSTGSSENLDLANVELQVGSVCDSDFVRRAVAGSDGIIHLAALGSVPRSLQDPRASFDVNAIGTLNVLEAAREHSSHVVVASSSSVYGSVREVPRTPELPTRPSSPYGASKLAAEALALAYMRSFGLPGVAFRFFNVYGPRQNPEGPYAAVIPKFIRAAVTGTALRIDGDGEQIRDFTHVSTVAEAVIASSVATRTIDTPVNLALGAPISINELADNLELVLGFHLPRVFGEPRSGDVRDSTCDPKQFRDLFPEVRRTDLFEGLTDTVNWFRSVL